MASTDTAAKPRALAGLVVVELAGGVAPAFCGKWLAAFGADVITIAAPTLDPAGAHQPCPGVVALPGNEPLSRYLNTGKRGISLDLASSKGRDHLRALIVKADCLIHTLEPADWPLEIDRAIERAVDRGLVEVAISPFGRDGPYAGYAASSIVLLALGGYQYLTGEPGREPLALPGFQPEYLSALYALVAALAAKLGQQQRGRGARVELSAFEVMASLHQFTVSQFLNQGTIRSRHGSRWENLYPITLLPCRDGYVGLAITLQDQWERLCLMLERPDLIEDPRFATAELRRANAELLDAILVGWLAGQDKLQFFQRAQEQWRLPVGPLYDLREVLNDPQYEARGFWVRPEGADGPVQPGLAATMSETPWVIRPSPQPGEQTRENAGGPAAPAAAKKPVAGGSSAGVRADAPATLPLTGLRVLDFTRVWSGPVCTRILADLGATVIKIEAPQAAQAPSTPPGAAAGERLMPPPARGGAAKLNRNKLGMVLDLRLAGGRDLVRRLVAKSDVLVENFSARVMPNFGLAYADLRVINPALVMLSMPGFGLSGPYRNYMAYGPAIEPMTGLTSLLGYAGEPPLASAIAYPDAVAGLTAAAAILTALTYQRRGGHGQFIDLSQLEATTSLIGEFFLAYQLTGVLPDRIGNGHPLWAPHGTYRCRGEDAWLSLAVRSDGEWAGFCTATGLSELREHPDYRTAKQRRQHHQVLNQAVSAWSATRDKFEAMQTLQSAGVPAGAVLNAKELLEDPQLARRGFYVRTQGGDHRGQIMAGLPFLIDGQRRPDWHLAPSAGEHNHAVLRDMLGLDEPAINALERQGVFGAVRETIRGG